MLEIVETPGHTPESISVLVYEHASDAVPYGVLTGDALFIGDVGRPDLLASIGSTADELGRQLYDSIQHKLMRLPDEVRVFPAHGAGSACGKNLSTQLQSTIGQQRLSNYACQPMSVEAFLEVVTEGQPAAPEYFVYDAILNRSNHAVLAGDRELPRTDPHRRGRGTSPRSGPGGHPRRARTSPPATWPARSTSRQTDGSPRRQAWSSSPTRRSWSSPRRATSRRSPPAWRGSGSTTRSATCRRWTPRSSSSRRT